MRTKFWRSVTGCRSGIRVTYRRLDSTQLTMVDVDGFEAEKFEKADWIYARAEDFIADLANEHVDRPSWLESCYEWREAYPWLEPGTHDDRNGYINSYRFTHKLSEYLKPTM